MFEIVLKNFSQPLQDAVRSVYTDGGFSGPCGSLASAIWHNTNLNVILDKLPSCLDLNALYTKNKFTLLTLAAIQGNVPVMQALKDQGANLDAQDRMNHTALHHMALLGNEQGVNRLLDWRAKPDLRTRHGATYADLLRFNAPFRNGTAILQPHLLSAHTNDKNEFDKSCISPEVQVVDEMVATPEILTRLYANEAVLLDDRNSQNALTDKTQNFFLSRYETFKKNPPKLAVKTTGNFCGLFAQQAIKKGEVLAEYIGKMINGDDDCYENCAYLYSGYPAIDAGLFRSPASMANDGCPNASAYILEKIDGLPNRKVLFALEDIKEGDEIRVSYGIDHGVRNLKEYQILGFDSLQKYCRKHSWKADYKIIESVIYNKIPPDMETYMDALNTAAKIQFILETPAVVEKLCNRGLISSTDIHWMNKINDLFNLVRPESQSFREGVLDIARDFFVEDVKDEL